MQPLYELTIHPVDLRAHGLNPYGQPLYRVVWADTRKCKVVCRGKVHILPRYHHGEEGSAAGKWVLEKWAPAKVIIGMTREQYETMLSQFPTAAAEEYPDRGDYELSYVFPTNVDDAFLHAQLSMHEHRLKTLSLNDRKVEMEAAEDKKEQVAQEKFDNIFEQAREDISCH